MQIKLVVVVVKLGVETAAVVSHSILWCCKAALVLTGSYGKGLSLDFRETYLPLVQANQVAWIDKLNKLGSFLLIRFEEECL